MNPAQLLSHFDRISEAPDAVPRLRRFILDLAVRGRLVGQDPRDEPASELLRDIEAKKMWNEFEPRLKEFGQEVHEEVSAVLTTEQRTKLDAAIAQRRASKQRRHECGPNDSTRLERKEQKQ